MSIIDKIISTAENEVGYKESPMGSGNNKYGEAYGWNYVAWCVMFVWYIFNKCKVSNLFFDGGKTASCGAFYRWAYNKGYIVIDGKKGDIVIYSFRKNKDGTRETSHMGIVKNVDSKYVYSIEGNTCTYGSQDNGGHVMEQKRNKSLVYAFIRPRYEFVEDKDEEPKKEYEEYTVKKGDTLWAIAVKFYGKGNDWRRIYDYNGLTSTVIMPNKVLKIPCFDNETERR